MSEARVASVQWKAEQQLRNAPTGPAVSEVKHDFLAEALARPIEDALVRYQREGRAEEARRRAEEERRERERGREQRRASRDARQGWSEWIEGEVERRVAEHVKGQRDTNLDLLKLIDKHSEVFERIATRLDEVKRENVALREMLAQARDSFASLFAGVTQRLAVLEKDTTKNTATVAESFRAVSAEVARITATPIVKLYMEEAANDRRR
jgi:dsDNA-binding SOS-regulon protein